VALYVKIHSESKVHKPNASLLKIFVLEIFLANLLTKNYKKKEFSVIFVKIFFCR